MHRVTYPEFWEWLTCAVDYARLSGSMHTVLGWRIHLTDKTKTRTLMNFPMQANGADLLRLVCCRLLGNGITVCAPVHDAVLIEAAEGQIDDAVRLTQEIMQTASADILSGFPLRTDAGLIRHPARFREPKGVEMFERVMGILARLDPAGCC